MRPRAPFASALCLGVAVAACAPDADAPALPGFSEAGARAHLEVEARFLETLTAEGARDRIRDHARALTREPHMAGTETVGRTATWLIWQLEEMGFEVEVDRYEPWLPQPTEGRIEVVGVGEGADGGGAARAVQVGERLPVREPLPATAPPDLAADAPELLNWHAWSADGIAEGEVVYANRGLAEDYAALDSMGVDVGGRIVMARLGGAFRGVKVHEAERRGAAGLLLFPDPVDGGWAAGDTLPEGPYRPSRSVQRGTVMYMWRHTGDPWTPGTPSLPTDSARALDVAGEGGAEPPPRDRAINLPSIPVAPIDAASAGRLLTAIEGPEPPGSFRGALEATYAPGPGPLRVRMEVRQRWAPRSVRNVIARLPGRTDAEVLLGNHFDAWIVGGVDAHSGTVAMLEIARGLSELAASGWTPRRGVTLAFWDAEEFGIVGSTEWVEDHLEELRERAVAYLNVDVFTAGALLVQGSPALRDLVVSAARSVPDPVTGRSLAEHWAERFGDPGDAAADRAPEIGDIGAGSDWTAFLHHAGVPSLQWTMNGRGTYAVYHSVYDDFDYLSRWADSAFVHTPAFASAMGLAALRLAEAESLPFRYTDYAARIEEHLAALEEAHGIELGPEREALEGFREAAAAVEEAQRAALEAGATASGAAGGAADAESAEATEADAEAPGAPGDARAAAEEPGAPGDARRAPGDAARTAEIDRALPRVEQAFLDPAGLPGRPWYRHVLSAPGEATGYAALPLPAVAEALEAGDAAALEAEADNAAALEAARAQLRAAITRATEVLREAVAGG